MYLAKHDGREVCLFEKLYGLLARYDAYALGVGLLEKLCKKSSFIWSQAKGGQFCRTVVSARLNTVHGGRN